MENYGDHKLLHAPITSEAPLRMNGVLWVLALVALAVCENQIFLSRHRHRDDKAVQKGYPRMGSSHRHQDDTMTPRKRPRYATLFEEDQSWKVKASRRDVRGEVLDLIYALPAALVNSSIILEDREMSLEERYSALDRLSDEHPEVYRALRFIFDMFLVIDDSHLFVTRDRTYGERRAKVTRIPTQKEKGRFAGVEILCYLPRNTAGKQ
ncbi:hypothetical protein OESDEN_08946 [Oesophagostomum dentatum]|uniref:Uncharacterized protein n=1 Tax=Oesophagostomum dentatum TaxID=61180 RepID=A0A0B1T1V1_OESDE|nr:hypothetical protein OESDEN_08946 [Oesophagostomum dentatum]